MPHIELDTIDPNSPALRSFTDANGIKVDVGAEPVVKYSGTTEALTTLIREHFDSGDEADVAYLVGLIQPD